VLFDLALFGAPKLPESPKLKKDIFLKNRVRTKRGRIV
jgi:hypothetical protein